MVTKEIIDTRDLPIWCKVKAQVTNDWKTYEQILTYRWMDWAYWRFVDDEWTIIPARGKHKKEWDFYIFA